jgi:hypothetical protein
MRGKPIRMHVDVVPTRMRVEPIRMRVDSTSSMITVTMPRRVLILRVIICLNGCRHLLDRWQLGLYCNKIIQHVACQNHKHECENYTQRAKFQCQCYSHYSEPNQDFFANLIRLLKTSGNFDFFCKKSAVLNF